MLVVGFVGLYGGPFGDWGLRAGVHLGGGGLAWIPQKLGFLRNFTFTCNLQL